MAYKLSFLVLWLAWVAYWIWLARHVKPVVVQESRWARASHLLPILLAFALLWPQHLPLQWLEARFYPLADWQFWPCIGLTAAGLLWACWARQHLGENWSATISIRANHELVASGPYAQVRHPIYSGLLLAFLGTAAARGELRSVLAMAMVFAALYHKMRREEAWMRREFGAAYEHYCARVPALLPKRLFRREDADAPLK